MSATLDVPEDVLARFCRRWQIVELALFGSVLREDFGPDSDLDILVRLESGRSLIDHIALKQSLEDLLGVEVDVVTEKALHPLIRDKVLQEGVFL